MALADVIVLCVRFVRATLVRTADMLNETLTHYLPDTLHITGRFPPGCARTRMGLCKCAGKLVRGPARTRRRRRRRENRRHAGITSTLSARFMNFVENQNVFFYFFELFLRFEVI